MAPAITLADRDLMRLRDRNRQLHQALTAAADSLRDVLRGEPGALDRAQRSLGDARTLLAGGTPDLTSMCRHQRATSALGRITSSGGQR